MGIHSSKLEKPGGLKKTPPALAPKLYGESGGVFNPPEKPKSRLPKVKKRHWSLFDLSDDVLLRIYNFLGPADRVSFALSSRRLYATLSKPGERFMVQETDRLEILQRFERDGVYPMSILCALCEGFHRPRLVNEWDEEEATRACVRPGDRELYGKTMCETFPTYVHFDLVAAITRSWRHNLGFYNPQLLESSVTFSNPKVKGSINCRTEAKVINGSLILKTERVLSTGYRRAEALKGLPDLVRLLEKENDLGWCCIHVQWREIYPFVFTSDQTNDKKSQKLQCLWSHRNSCLRRSPWSLPMVCSGKINLNFQLWHCRNCYTDMTMGYAYIESDDVKLVTLTTWKDMGRGISVEDPVWKLHNTSDFMPRDLDLEALSMYDLFEAEGGKKAPNPYLPNPRKEVLLDLRDGPSS